MTVTTVFLGINIFTLNKTQQYFVGMDCLPCFEVLPPAPRPAAVSHPVFYCNHTQKKMHFCYICFTLKVGHMWGKHKSETA